MTLRERAEAYNRTFPDRPPMHANDRWLEGTWIIGNDYRNKTEYYGAYPAGYIDRVWALFPDMVGKPFLHLFSGSLDERAGGVRVDIRQDISGPSVRGDALALPFQDRTFDFTMADTPYGEKHAVRYGTKMPSRRAVLYEVARVTKPGGFLVWLDTKLPMFSKTCWNWVGIVMVVRSTNHDYRGAAIFQRTFGRVETE